MLVEFKDAEIQDMEDQPHFALIKEMLMVVREEAYSILHFLRGTICLGIGGLVTKRC